MTYEHRCYICGKVWYKDKVSDPPPWFIIYTFCGVCIKKMMHSFEEQFDDFLPSTSEVAEESHLPQTKGLHRDV